jgi:hypothetical protein
MTKSMKYYKEEAALPESATFVLHSNLQYETQILRICRNKFTAQTATKGVSICVIAHIITLFNDVVIRHCLGSHKTLWIDVVIRYCEFQIYGRYCIMDFETRFTCKVIIQFCTKIKRSKTLRVL